MNPPKSSLGRGLTELMPGSKGAAPVGTPPPVCPPGAEASPPDLGRGLSTLLNGNGQTNLETAPAVSVSEHPSSEPSVPVALPIGLVCADLLLVVQAALLILGHSTPVGLGETTFCAFSIGIGAWLSVMAIHLYFRKE